jgi:Domain of unknown function (DUF4440)
MKSFLACLSFLFFSTTTLAQWDGLNPPIDPRTNMDGYPTSRRAGDSPTLKDLSSRETKLWQARVSGKTDSISQSVSEDATIASSTGAANRKELIAQAETGVCTIRSYRLQNFVLKLATPEAALITYRAEQDGACNGKALPQTLNVSTSYIKRHGKWWSVSYQETAAAPPAPDGKSR